MVPSVLFWAGAVLAGVLVALLLLRRSRGALLRALSLAALLLALANPTLRQEERESLANIAIVVVDESLSQSIGGRPEQTAAIRRELESKLAGIANLQVRWVTSSRPNGETASGTNLFADLNSALANTPPDRLAGVIMITDGQVHDVPKAAQTLGFDAPVHALLTGQPDEFDRRIEVLKAPRYGIVGSTRDIEARVVETGRRGRAGDRVTLKIRREGRADETRSTQIGRTVQIPMPFPHAGQNIVEVELETASGELTPANNRVVVVAEGVRENLRVLLVSGEPHAGERTWRNLLKSDASVDLVHFTILRPPEKQDGTPINELSLIAFPTRELFQQKISEFQLIIFDRYARQGVLPLIYFDNIAKYVQDGGAVMVAAGPDYASPTSIWRTPLDEVLPAEPSGDVTEEPFFARLTQAGERHPVTRGLEGSDTNPPHWSQWFRLVNIKRSSGTSVMDGPDGKPLLVLAREGKGRVALLLSDHIWLWARDYEGGGPHLDLLRRLSHWLMKQPELEEEALRLKVQGRTITVERQTMSDSVNAVTLTAPTGAARTLALHPDGPGIWHSSVEANELGLWRATDGKLTALANVGPANPREFQEVTSTTDVLRKLAQATGGEARRLDEGRGLTMPRVTPVRTATAFQGDDWIGLKMRDASVVRGIGVLPVFSGLLGLLLLIGSLAATWAREGR
jgi:hypothetical protein